MKSTSKPSTRSKTAAPASRTAKPAASKAAAPKLVAVKLVASKPAASKSAASKSAAAKVAASKPVAPKLVAVKPVASKPVATKPFTPTNREIATRAYELYAKSGHQPGREVEFWLEAERQLQREPQRN